VDGQPSPGLSMSGLVPLSTPRRTILCFEAQRTIESDAHSQSHPLCCEKKSPRSWQVAKRAASINRCRFRLAKARKRRGAALLRAPHPTRHAHFTRPPQHSRSGPRSPAWPTSPAQGNHIQARRLKSRRRTRPQGGRLIQGRPCTRPSQPVARSAPDGHISRRDPASTTRAPQRSNHETHRLQAKRCSAAAALEPAHADLHRPLQRRVPQWTAALTAVQNILKPGRNVRSQMRLCADNVCGSCLVDFPGSTQLAWSARVPDACPPSLPLTRREVPANSAGPKR